MHFQFLLTLIPITTVIAIPFPGQGAASSGQAVSDEPPKSNALRNFAVGIPVVGTMILGGLKWLNHLDEKSATEKDREGGLQP